MLLVLVIGICTLLIAQVDVDSLNKTIGDKFFEAAKKYLGVPFVWEGRSKEKLDCMGLIFLAYKDVTGKDWKKLSVYPSKLVKSGKLGRPVEGLDGVLKGDFEHTKLRKGDIIYFLVTEKIYDTDVPLVNIDSIPYWVWHMGIFAGFDSCGVALCLNARPGDKVVIEPLEDIYFDAIFVTRFDTIIEYQSSRSSPENSDNSPSLNPSHQGREFQIKPSRGAGNRIESREEIVKNLQKLMADNKAVVIYAIVTLCDNKHQGIIPVPQRFGNGDDPKNNLYWGAGGGVKTYFKKSKEWRMVVNVENVSENILERCIFKRKDKNVYMIADAYRGGAIKEAIFDFLNVVAKDTILRTEIGLPVNEVNLDFKNGVVPQLVCYVGHNGLLDFTLDSLPKPSGNNKPKDVIILACLSKNSFYNILDSLGGYPLLWTTNLLAPEAYTLNSAIDGWVELGSGEEIKSRAAKEYNRYQKCGLNAARKLFATGW